MYAPVDYRNWLVFCKELRLLLLCQQTHLLSLAKPTPPLREGENAREEEEDVWVP